MSANPHTSPLAVALFEAFARNGGNRPNDHFDRNAAEQWMQQALDECLPKPAAAQEAAAYWRVTFRMYPTNVNYCEAFVRGPARPTLETLGITPRPAEIISAEPLYAAPVTAAPADLIERCREILAWQRTGVLPGDALRAYANARWPDEHDPLQIAEKETAREAFRILAMAAAASTPAAPGIDMGVHGATLTIDGETFTVDEVRPVLAGALADAKRLNFLIRTYSHLRMRNGAWVVAVGGETPTPGEGYPTACAAIDAAMQAQAGDAEVQP